MKKKEKGERISIQFSLHITSRKKILGKILKNLCLFLPFEKKKAKTSKDIKEDCNSNLLQKKLTRKKV